jgi:hypothetical protein
MSYVKYSPRGALNESFLSGKSRMKIHLLCHMLVIASLRATLVDSFSAAGAEMIRQELIDHQVRVQNESFVWSPWLDRHTCLPAVDVNFSDVTT